MLLVVVIISIIAGIAIPVYNKSKEHGLGKEAVANLKLIYAAEHIYKMDHGNYIACSCSSAANCNAAGGCNTLLKLNLNTGNWTYSAATGGVFGGGWYADALRVGSGGYLDCRYRVRFSDDLSSSNPGVYLGTSCP